MSDQEIIEAIETILYNAEYTNKVHGFRFYATERSAENDFYYKYYNKTVELLRFLHQKLVDKKEKDFLLNSLAPRPGILTLLPNQPKAFQLACKHQDFVFVFLIKIKELNSALKMLARYITVSSTNNNLLKALSEILEVEPSTFDNATLNEILLIVDKFLIFINGLKYYTKNTNIISGNKRVPMYDVKKIEDYKAAEKYNAPECEQLLDNIQKRIYRIKENRLSNFLEGVNFEINQDETQLQNIISEFGFNKKLNETISKINEKLYNAKDPFDFKNCIDLIRALLNELCKSIALEIQNKRQIQPTIPIDSMGTAEQYFRDNRVNFLTQTELEFIVKYNAFISGAGVHALQSEREYARISRNLVIELGLFLVEKLKKYLS